MNREMNHTWEGEERMSVSGIIMAIKLLEISILFPTPLGIELEMNEIFFPFKIIKLFYILLIIYGIPCNDKTCVKKIIFFQTMLSL